MFSSYCVIFGNKRNKSNKFLELVVHFTIEHLFVRVCHVIGSLARSSSFCIEHISQVYCVHCRASFFIQWAFLSNPEVYLMFQIMILDNWVQDNITITGIKLAMQCVILQYGIEIINLPNGQTRIDSSVFIEHAIVIQGGPLEIIHPIFTTCYIFIHLIVFTFTFKILQRF